MQIDSENCELPDAGSTPFHLNTEELRTRRKIFEKVEMLL